MVQLFGIAVWPHTKRQQKLVWLLVLCVLATCLLVGVILAATKGNNRSSIPTGPEAESLGQKNTTKPAVSSAPTTSPSDAPVASVFSPRPSGKPFTSETISSPPTLAPFISEPTSVPSFSEPITSTPSSAPSVAVVDVHSVTTPGPSFDPFQGLEITYKPGHLTRRQNGLLLSEGLVSRVIATKNQKVKYDVRAKESESKEKFHERPDFGATFPDESAENRGGWVYVSNSEMEKEGAGGVGAITFDKDGNVTDYKMVLTGTTMNCGGGRTPWNTWISCEEYGTRGQVYEVDPFGKRKARIITMGDRGGRFESFAFDDRNKERPSFYVSEDQRKGALRRWIPDNADWKNPYDMLHGKGVLDFLVLEPDSKAASRGTFRWTKDHNEAKMNAEKYYPNSEGIDRDGHLFYLVCKGIRTIFILNLDKMTYVSYPTENGMFDGAPDQVKRVLNDDHDILYFTEENGRNSGIHGRNSLGQFFTILEGPGYSKETTGLSFSPDGKHMYVAFQDDGVLVDVWREDGRPFHGKSLDVRYHNKAVANS